MKYFIPPFFAMLAFVTFLGALKDITFVIFIIVFGYPITLFIHLIGCCYIKFLKYQRCYNLPILLISGFIFGAIASNIFFPKATYSVIIMFSLSGMLNCWVYYYFDKKTIKVSNNLAS